MITINMTKAIEIRKNKLREERSPLLSDLDVQYQRADEVGDKNEKQRIAELKQRLRDITDDPRFSVVRSTDDLRRITLQDQTDHSPQPTKE